MNVQIQAVKFDADRKLIEFVEAKMAKLDRFIERATGADVILKLDKDNEKGNKVAIIRIEVPGERPGGGGPQQKFRGVGGQCHRCAEEADRETQGTLRQIIS